MKLLICPLVSTRLELLLYKVRIIYHLSGWFQGEDMAVKLPNGAEPVRLVSMPQTINLGS